MAAIFSARVLVLTVVLQKTRLGEEHFTTGRILAGYWSAAIVLTGILAAVRPWLDTRWAAGLAGLLGGVAIYDLMGLWSSDGTWVEFLGAGILGGLIGLGLGFVEYDDVHSEPMTKQREGRRIRILIVSGIVLFCLMWAMTSPPLCFLGGKFCK